MSNIYLKVAVEKNWCSQIVTRSVFSSSNSIECHCILKLLVVTWKSEVWQQNCLKLFYYFKFEKNFDVLKSKSQCILLNKNMNTFFVPPVLSEGNILKHMWFILMYSVLNTLSEYMHFCILKKLYPIHFFDYFWNLWKSLVYPYYGSEVTVWKILNKHFSSLKK